MIDYKFRKALPSVHEYIKKDKRKTLTVSLKDFYWLYKKRGGKTPLNVYKEFFSRVFWGINKELIGGKIYKPPGERGFIGIKKTRNRYKKNTLSYHRSRSRGVVKEKINNLHSAGYIFKFHWWHNHLKGGPYPVSKIKNQMYYKFKSCRDKDNKEIGQDGLAMEIERRRNDPYLSEYDAFRNLPLVFQNRNR